jgi:Cys-tRNA(Pro)/Cys-tRNA(Cys) deacylase
VIPVNCTLNLKHAAKLLKVKNVEMVDPKDAERITGYIVGGISPLGQKKLVKTLIDAEAVKHDEILVSGGKRGLSIGLKPQELIGLLNATVGEITDLQE